MAGQRVQITLTVVLVEGAGFDEAAEQMFNLVASDPLDLAPLIAEVENWDWIPE